MNQVFLGLGTNVGDRMFQINEALAQLSAVLGQVTAQSSIYATQAWGLTEQDDFLNAVVQIETHLNVEDVLQQIQSIEQSMGRDRSIKWGPRTIDIDILFFNDEIIEKEHLTVPHPLLQERLFVLQPMLEIAPNYIHPKLAASIEALIEIRPDQLKVQAVIPKCLQ
jgi:2-amino-4-hydroxy-6-hydroxymethyldihydropteridine diphosphokinase